MTRFDSPLRSCLIGCWPLISLLLGCTGPPSRPDLNGPPEGVIAQGESPLKLLDFGPRVVSASMGGDGRVHVLAMGRSRDVYHLVVSRNGVEQQDIVMHSSSGHAVIASSFDGAGRLHAVVGDQHILLQGDRWGTPEKGPPCQRLVRAGADLHCAFVSAGRLRMDLAVIPFFLVPLPSRNHLPMLACQTSSGWSTWAVIDPTAKRDATELAIAGDDAGSVQIVYLRGRTVIADILELAYARVPAPADCAARGPEAQVSTAAAKAEMDTGGANGGKFYFDIATNPESGESLRVEHCATANTIQAYLAPRDPAKMRAVPAPPRRGLVRIAPAGNDRFHALIRYVDGKWAAYYTAFVGGAWSPAVELGPAECCGYDEAVQLVSDGADNALALWSDHDKLMARWVTLAIPPGEVSPPPP